MFCMLVYIIDVPTTNTKILADTNTKIWQIPIRVLADTKKAYTLAVTDTSTDTLVIFVYVLGINNFKNLY